MKRLYIALALLAALGACGEKPQTGAGNGGDTPAYTGSASPAFMQPGWKAGDKAEWQAQLKTRQQYGQNEYNRSSAQ